MDDGLQHWAVHKDINILMINCLDGMSQPHVQHLLPRGMLREKWSDALGRADIVVFNHCDLVALSDLKEMVRHVKVILETSKRPNTTIMYSKMVPRALQQLNSFGKPDKGRRLPLADIANTFDQVHGICGIGCPDSFRLHLGRIFNSDERTKIFYHFFPDHHAYKFSDMHSIRRKASQTSVGKPPGNNARRQSIAIITTEKDYHRSREVFLKSFESSLETNYMVFCLLQSFEVDHCTSFGAGEEI